MDLLYSSVNRSVSVETVDGMFRVGRMTSISYSTFEMNGKKCSIPNEIELNGDVTDTVPIERIRKITLK